LRGLKSAEANLEYGHPRLEGELTCVGVHVHRTFGTGRCYRALASAQGGPMATDWQELHPGRLMADVPGDQAGFRPNRGRIFPV
jgi:hypothetical protein